MSDKELVLEVIQRLPKNATLMQIRERIDFLATLKEAPRSLDRGEGTPQEEVDKKFSPGVKQSYSKKAKAPVGSRRLKAIGTAAGLWLRRTDLPDFHKLRREWDRFQP